MVDIIQEIHEKYVPTTLIQEPSAEGDINFVPEVMDKVFFGGDQLTEERARNAVYARADGDTQFERLEGIIPKNEDWHGIRLVYQVLILLA